MDDVYVYFVQLPPGVREMVTPCADGYTVYIDECLDQNTRKTAYLHAIEHINNYSFEFDNVQEIENMTHRKDISA